MSKAIDRFMEQMKTVIEEWQENLKQEQQAAAPYMDARVFRELDGILEALEAGETVVIEPGSVKAHSIASAIGKTVTGVRTGYLATIKVLVDADSESEACDVIGELLRGDVVDWCYLLEGDDPTPYTLADWKGPQQPTACYPTPFEIPDNYEEGDAFDHN